MSRSAKIWQSAKTNPSGLTFAELQRLAEAARFVLSRVKGDHHVYTRSGIVEIINLQPKRGKAKPYQVRQVLDLIEKYRIEIE
jgi:hypothetical protein